METQNHRPHGDLAMKEAELKGVQEIRDRIAAVLAETPENIEAVMGWLIAIISERDRTSVEVMAKSLLSRQRAKAGLP